MLKVYQISTNLVHIELRNATFEGKKIATSIKRPDSDKETFKIWRHVAATQPGNIAPKYPNSGRTLEYEFPKSQLSQNMSRTTFY